MSGIVLLVHGSTSQNDILEITGCAKDIALGVALGAFRQHCEVSN